MSKAAVQRRFHPAALIPNTLFGRIAAIIVIGVLVLHAGSYAFWSHREMVGRAQTFALSVIDRALAFETVWRQDETLAQALSGPGFSVERVTEVSWPSRTWPHSDEIEATVRAHLAAVGYDSAERVQFGYYLPRRSRPRFVVALPLAGDAETSAGWLRVEADTSVTRRHGPAEFMWMTSLVLLITGAVLFFTRRHTRYLGRLADAVAGVGDARAGGSLDESSGSREMRRVSAAFNAMQRRVSEALRERTEMVGAISHDLRTVATRLTLRSEFIDDETQREKASADLDEMQGILDQALLFARDQVSEEAFVRLDLVSLVQAVADDAADLGHEASVSAPEQVEFVGQPIALKRAIGNLVQNAIRYGGAASIRVSSEPLEVAVTDPGDGMTEREAEAATRAFVRLETSRNRTTGGTGLGLAIAKAVVERHGGRLRFRQLAGGGFEVAARLSHP